MKLETNYSYKDILISKSNQLLTVENATIRRVFDLSQVIPRTISIVNKTTQKEIACNAKSDLDFTFIGFNMPTEKATVEYQLQYIEIEQKDDSIIDSEHIEITLHIIDQVQQLIFKRCYYIYPDLPILSSRTAIESLTTPMIYWNRRGDFNDLLDIHKKESCSDSICLAPGFTPTHAVEFVGRTDYTDEQVISKTTVNAQETGNLLFCTDADNDGMFILQEAPPSSERRDYETYDFRISENNIYSCGWGIEPDEVGPDILWGYRHVVGLFTDDGTTGTAQLKRYLKARFPLDINKHCSVMVNPWGCGQFPKLVNEQFLKEELKASAALGATHYQIDDGWQKGQSLGELSTNNRVGDNEFWAINHDLLPNGFTPLTDTAKEAGIKAELWVAPSSNQHYRDWQEFADILFDYHLKYGFSIFKIDFIKTRTKDAEDNLEKMLRYLREKSDGKIYFNLDTTNGQRPGYFMFLEYGNIFLENRYVCHDWGLGYHPEKTLNNLWNLATYMRPQSLQIEFSDPGIINYDSYQQKGMTAPDCYTPEYWAGIAMFANPLVWLAPSRLEQKYADVYKKVIALHRKYAEDIFAGEIYPIGSEPNGASITGLQSHNDETGDGLFIVYRELNAPESATLELKLLSANQSYEISELSLKTENMVQSITGNSLTINLNDPGSWQLFRYAKKL